MTGISVQRIPSIDDGSSGAKHKSTMQPDQNLTNDAKPIILLGN